MLDELLVADEGRAKIHTGEPKKNRRKGSFYYKMAERVKKIYDSGVGNRINGRCSAEQAEFDKSLLRVVA